MSIKRAILALVTVIIISGCSHNLEDAANDSLHRPNGFSYYVTNAVNAIYTVKKEPIEKGCEDCFVYTFIRAFKK